MYRVASCLLVMVAAMCAGPAASEDATPPELIHSPWEKICVAGTCVLGARVRTECALVAGVTLTEKEGEAKRTLRVTLPSHVNLGRGVRIVIGQNQPIAGSYAGCTSSLCSAEYEGGVDLVDRLKQGATLVLEATNSADSPVTASLSLADFARAYDGPPSNPGVREMLHWSPKEYLQK
jgi:invasion protein IalB